MKSFIRWLPDRADHRVRLVAVLSLVFQIILIATGGAVRLTGSGLGCPTWPLCTEDSLVNTPEMGIHGVIEFANRLLSIVLGFVAIAAFLVVVKLRRERPELYRYALIQGIGIILQAVIGGITVKTGLNSFVVGIHFVLSIGLVITTTMLVFRVYNGPRSKKKSSPVWYLVTVHLTSFFLALTIVVGVLTTGSGPHAGDATTARNGLDPELMQHLHSWPAYITGALTLILLISASVTKLAKRWVWLLLLTETLQIGVGLWQANTGLPPLLVGIHLVLSACLVSVMTTVVLAQRSSGNQPIGNDNSGSSATARNSTVK